MSWGTCFSGSNNIHFNFPPIMADGRNYASWQPEAVTNERIQKEADITTSWKYRQYLTQNGNEIMKFNSSEACGALGLPVHFQNDNTPSKNVPHLYKSTFDTSHPGFGYNNSDLKNPYLSREQLQARLFSPHLN
jgi:hypothetical protein|tara:strand:+ start:466 stop:867 length:402 start_codon:yes stop_codon:yes gene_type:complete